MAKIYKFPLPVDAYAKTTLMIPGATERPIHFGFQGKIPTLWAEVDPELQPLPSNYYLLATGDKVPYGSAHVGTAFLDKEIWHLYKAGEDD